MAVDDNPSFEPSKINVTQNVPLIMETEIGRYSIRPHDWNRIKRNIKRIPRPTDLPKIFITLFASMAVSFGISSITIFLAMTMTTIVILFSVISIFSIIGMICSIITYLKSKDIPVQTIDSIIEDMDDIESQFRHPEKTKSASKTANTTFGKFRDEK